MASRIPWGCGAAPSPRRSFALTALSVCYHNLAVQKLFLDAPAAAIACAAAALRLATDTKCLAKKHPWYHRMERTVEAARQYQDEGGPAANASFGGQPKKNRLSWS